MRKLSLGDMKLQANSFVAKLPDEQVSKEEVCARPSTWKFCSPDKLLKNTCKEKKICVKKKKYV